MKLQINTEQKMDRFIIAEKHSISRKTLDFALFVSHFVFRTIRVRFRVFVFSPFLVFVLRPFREKVDFCVFAIIASIITTTPIRHSLIEDEHLKNDKRALLVFQDPPKDKAEDC